MVSSFTTNKSLEKPANGDYVDTWNVPVNGDMDVIDQALGGTTFLNATGGSATLSVSQYRAMALSISGAMSGNVTYTIPSGVGGVWIVYNNTTDASGGPWSITIASGGGGTNVVVRRGFNTTVYSDGTNIRLADNSAVAGGSDTQVQFNQATLFGGSPNFVFDYTNNRVGIGTSSPATRLHVAATDGVTNARFAGASYAIRMQSIAATGASVEATNNTEATYQPLLLGGSQINFTTSGVQGATLLSSGRFGVNIVNPVNNLEVGGNIAVSGANYIFSYQGGVNQGQVRSGLQLDGGNAVLGFWTGQTERARFDANGNFGIGTSAPAVKLSFGTQFVGNNGYANAIRLYDDGSASTSQTSNSYGFGFINNGALSYNAGTGGYHALFTSNTERVRLTAAGDLGVGVTAPAARLDVTGPANSLQARFGNVAGRGLEIATQVVGGTNDAGSILNAKGSSAGTLIFQTDSVERARITNNGDVGIGTGSPTAKLSVNGIINQISQGTSSAQINAINSGGTFYHGLDNSVGGTFGSPYAAALWHNGNYPMIFATAGTERLRINADGGVGLSTNGNTVFAKGLGYGGNVSAAAYGFLDPYNASTGATLLYNTGAYNLILGTSNTERLRVDPNGLIGISNSTPSQLLTVGSATSGTGIGFGNDTSNFTNIFSAYSSAALVMGAGIQGGRSSDIYTSSYGGASIYRNAIRLDIGSGGIQFLANPAAGVSRGSTVSMIERMRITPDGLVGINTNNPLARLHVNGTIYSSSGGFIFPDGTSQTTAAFNLGYTPVNKAGDTMTGTLQINVANTGILRLNSSNYINAIYFMNGSSVTGQLGANSSYPFYVQNASSADTLYCDQSGNFYAVGNITAYSDRSLKENIEQIGDALSKVSKMVGVSYNRKLTGKKEIGLVAQDVRDVVPEVVSEGADGTLGVAYGNLVAMCVEAIKELKGRVEALEAR